MGNTHSHPPLRTAARLDRPGHASFVPFAFFRKPAAAVIGQKTNSTCAHTFFVSRALASTPSP
jgi:hypothetical protein